MSPLDAVPSLLAYLSPAIKAVSWKSGQTGTCRAEAVYLFIYIYTNVGICIRLLYLGMYLNIYIHSEMLFRHMYMCIYIYLCIYGYLNYVRALKYIYIYDF